MSTPGSVPFLQKKWETFPRGPVLEWTIQERELLDWPNRRWRLWWNIETSINAPLVRIHCTRARVRTNRGTLWRGEWREFIFSALKRKYINPNNFNIKYNCQFQDLRQARWRIGRWCCQGISNRWHYTKPIRAGAQRILIFGNRSLQTIRFVYTIFYQRLCTHHDCIQISNLLQLINFF